MQIYKTQKIVENLVGNYICDPYEYRNLLELLVQIVFYSFVNTAVFVEIYSAERVSNSKITLSVGKCVDKNGFRVLKFTCFFLVAIKSTSKEHTALALLCAPWSPVESTKG